MGADCPAWLGWLTLVVGVLYLLSDLGVLTAWGDTFQWWTVAFVLVGLGCVVGNSK